MDPTKSYPQIELPVKPLHNPLSAEHEQILQWVMPRLPVAEDMLLRAAAAGIDIGDRGARHEAHVAIANKIKQLYFPDQLPITQE